VPHAPTPEWASVSCVNDKCEGQLRVVDEFFFYGQRSGDLPPVFINCGPTRPVLSWWRDLSGSRRVARRQPEAAIINSSHGTHTTGGRPWGSHGVMPSRRAAARGHPRARGVHAVAEWMHGAALHRCTRCATHPGDQAYALVSSEHRGPRWREGGSWRELETRLT